jgi:hypothetical protein
MRHAYAIPGVDEKALVKYAQDRFKVEGQHTFIHQHRDAAPCKGACYVVPGAGVVNDRR